MLLSYKKSTYLSFGAVLVCVLLLTLVTYAQAAEEFKPLVGLPGLQGINSSTSLTTYINAVYLLTITLGALIGVIKIAFAGVKYSLSDIVTDKASAKKDIQGVLLGLAILLIPFIVLQQIYPGLTNLEVLKSATPINLQRSTSAPTATPTISSSDFREQAGDFTESARNLGVSSRPVSAEEITAFEGMCKEVSPNSKLIVSNIGDGKSIKYGYSCSK